MVWGEGCGEGGRGTVEKCVNRRCNLPMPARPTPSLPLKSLTSRLIKRQLGSGTCAVTLSGAFSSHTPGTAKSRNDNETAAESQQPNVSLGFKRLVFVFSPPRVHHSSPLKIIHHLSASLPGWDSSIGESRLQLIHHLK